LSYDNTLISSSHLNTFIDFTRFSEDYTYFPPYKLFRLLTIS